MPTAELKTMLANLPDDPGVYIMYDADGNILYVGKAKNLKNRVRQYFHAGTNKNEKVLAMLSHVDTFRYIICSSETDALSLENTLIKKHTPPYNIMLKDDKQYPYVKVDLSEDFPKFVPTRKLARDKFKYFGPITAGGIRTMMEILGLVFPTATCGNNLGKLPKNFRPCLNYHIGKCSAPCINKISKEDYRKIVDDAVEFLSGNDKRVSAALFEKMMEASESLQYEQAMLYKRYIEVIEKLSQQRIVVLSKFVDYDMFAIAGNQKNAVVNHTMIRGGKVVFSDNSAVSDAGIEPEQTLQSFLLEYSKNVNLCGEIYTNVKLPDSNEIAALLSEISGKTVKLKCPEKQDKKRLVDMAYRNAVEFLTKSQADIDRQFNSTVGAVEQLKQLLNLKILPKRIECFDISNISGVDKVASMVVFQNGKKDAKSYRRFKIKTVEGANDFASMKEVILRRLLRLKENDAGFPEPDLIVVDGGLGQLDYAKQAMEEAGIEVQLISLAKREEMVYLSDKKAVFLPRNSFALHLLINARDEAHRFAVTYFRKLHGKNALKSVLREIEGIGEKRQIELQRKFKSLESLEKATVEELLETKGITRPVAEKIFEFFRKE